ncbi:MAG: acyltransferase family protein [Lachnospiraceae bacterium]|nr:acyltransferase family protein [Lachnospiraceae bacterium]
MIRLYKKNPGGGYSRRDYLTLESTTCIKGLFAILVLIHHLYQHSGVSINGQGAYCLQSLGYLSVAMFLFLSGYGLQISYLNKGEQYIVNLPSKRILPLYLQYILLVGIYLAFFFVIDKSKITVKLIITSFVFGGTVVSKGWYLQLTLALYLLYWLVYSTVKRKRTLAIVIGLVFICVLCLVLQLGIVWFQSIFSFALGIFWANNKEKIDSKCVESWGLFTGVFLITFVCSLVLSYYIIPIRVCTIILFCVLTLLLLMRVSINNKLMKGIGTYSFDIYVMQGIPLALLHSDVIYIENKLLYMLLCTIITLILAIAIHPVFQFINKAVKRKVTA